MSKNSRGKRYAENAVVHQYIEDVLKGRLIVGNLQRLAVERHLKDLVDGPKRGLSFNPGDAQASIDFMRYCRHSKGKWAGEVLVLSGWQAFCQWNIYGWKKDHGRRRRFFVVFIEVARKNGKSTWMSGNGIYLAFFEGEAGAEVYTAGTKRDQARIIHKESISMVRKSPDLSELLTVYKDSISCVLNDSIYIPLGKDSNTMDGLNVHAGLIDEYHAHKNADVFSILETGTGSRENPLMWVITTAGDNQEYPCFEYHTLSEQILRGTIQDDSWFAFICCLDEGDKWTDETVWVKANPNLGVSVYMDGLKTQFQKAVKIPSEQNKFQCKRLNKWTQQSKRWLSLEVWDENKGTVDAEALKGVPCIGGFDLSSVSDLTALVMIFPVFGEFRMERLKVLCKFWVPEWRIRSENKHKYLAQYQAWAEQGFLTVTPGEALDYDQLEAEIVELSGVYPMREVWIDLLFQGHQIEQRLREQHGLNMQIGRMGMLSMSPVAKELERLLLSRKLEHGGNPILRWMADCVTVRTDHSGNIMPDKGKSQGKIDGIVALCMALMGIVKPTDENDQSIYNEKELLIV